MINFAQAKLAFKQYIQDYDVEYGKIELKIRHTYGVVETSEYIAKKLSLNQEDIELAKLIALLHDIGRFEQIKSFDCFIDSKTTDHAILGNDILFKNKLIRNFIKEKQYDRIISKSILNHNKLTIENNLEDRELLHAKIIRDADKIDNFRVKATDDFENIIDNANREMLENDIISDKVFHDFMDSKVIIREDRNTYMDFWVSYIAFLFDFNFISSLAYIKEMDYMNKVMDRLDYKNRDTKQKMEKMRKHAIGYMEDKIKRNINNAEQ